MNKKNSNEHSLASSVLLSPLPVFCSVFTLLLSGRSDGGIFRAAVAAAPGAKTK
jgi:hypothetical protein